MRLTRSLLAAACALALLPASASAATQTKDDGDDGVPSPAYGSQFDLRQARWDVTADQTTLTFGFEGPMTDSSRFYFFIDTNRDGKSDFAVDGYTPAGDDGKAVALKLVTTPQSTATCQKAIGQSMGHGNVLLTENTAVPTSRVSDGIAYYSFSFPTSMIGGAQSFDWAGYGMQFDYFNNTWEYMPDGANYDTSRPNPVTTVKDYCDGDGNGSYGDDGDSEDSQSGAVPLTMADGFTFPDENGTPDPGAGGWEHTTADTTKSGQMPNVGKLRVDLAQVKILRSIGSADFDVKEVNLAKPPKGVGFGDVVTQSPKPGTTLTGGFGSFPKVKLETYAGPRPKGAKDCLDKLAKEVKGLDIALATNLLKKAGCRVSYDFKLGSSDKEVVTKVSPRAKDQVELGAQVPSRAEKQNLFLNVRENPNNLSFDAPRPQDGYAGFNLLSSRDQTNCVTIQVVDRAGRLVPGAQLRIDTSDVGAPADPRVNPTGATGETPVCFLAPKAGRIDIVTWFQGDNDLAIYGGHSFNVADSSKLKPGSKWYTTSGRLLTKGAAGGWSIGRKPKLDARAAVAGDYGPLVNWLIGLFTGNSPQAVQTLSEGSIGSGQKLNNLCGNPKTGACPAILAVGDGAVGKGEPKLVEVVQGKVVASGGGNAVSAGGGNVIAKTGANVVTGATSGSLSAGGGNIISQNHANIISQNHANLISDNGLGLISDNGLGLISDNGLGLISDNGLGLTAAVGSGLISINNGGLLAGGR